jgi:LmbE family N-acetylglucosaminyl deacetylase
MIKKLFLLFIFFCLTKTYGLCQLTLDQDDRILVLSPHPDDEAIALTGLIQRSLKAGSKIKIVYLTNGDYNELSYLFYKKKPAVSRERFVQIGQTRQREARDAMRSLGLKEDELIFLGYPDRFTETILIDFWDNNKPFRSLITNINKVPYKDAFSPGAPYVAESILKDLKRILSDYKPTKIFVSSLFDTNPDHRSLYLYLYLSLLDLENELSDPLVLSYLIHKKGWPLPKGYRADLSLEPPKGSENKSRIWEKFYLTKEEREIKFKTLSFYESQLAFDKAYLLSFIRQNELFYSDPLIDLNGGKYIYSSKINPKLSCNISFYKDDKLIYIEATFNKKIAKKIDLYLLGYKKSRSFSYMPKVILKVRGEHLIIYEKRRPAFINATSMVIDRNKLFIKFPLTGLENPDYIFSCIILKGTIGSFNIMPWSIFKTSYLRHK